MNGWFNRVITHAACFQMVHHFCALLRFCIQNTPSILRTMNVHHYNGGIHARPCTALTTHYRLSPKFAYSLDIGFNLFNLIEPEYVYYLMNSYCWSLVTSDHSIQKMLNSRRYYRFQPLVHQFANLVLYTESSSDTVVHTYA